jgi:hypothetical protein
MISNKKASPPKTPAITMPIFEGLAVAGAATTLPVWEDARNEVVNVCVNRTVLPRESVLVNVVVEVDEFNTGGKYIREKQH